MTQALTSVIKGDEIYENPQEKDLSDYISAKIARHVKNSKKLEKKLAEIEGQDHVTEYVKEALFAIQQKENSKGVLACLTFIGPPASGKSLAGEMIAQALDVPWKRFDMSHYSTKEASNDFIGLHPSFKSSEPGDITKFVYDNPFCVVILDEIEKAHSSILKICYQMFESGEIVDLMMKETVNFRNVIVVVTSNVGASIYDSSISRYNNAQISESTIVKAMTNEINPATGVPFLPKALISRLRYGKIILFNRLRPECVHRITKKAIVKEIALFKKEHGIDIEVDADELAKTFIFELGENSDVRALTQKPSEFFKRSFSRAVDIVRESGSERYFTHMVCSFNKNNMSREAHEMFFRKRKSRIAVFCSEQERELFDSLVNENTEIFYIGESFKLVDILRIDASAIIIGTQDKSDRFAKRIFLESTMQDSIPIYVYSKKKIGKTPFLYYTDKGATDYFFPGKLDMQLNEWLDDIVNGLDFSSITQDMFRASKVMTYDVIISHDDAARNAVISIGDYDIKSAMSATDSEEFVMAHTIPDVKFDDVIGAKEAKSELRTVVQMLKNYRQLRRDGIRVPRGLLLEGKPGTGKTMLAKALAAECNMPFIEKNGSEFLQKYVGEGANKMRELFAKARRYAPAVIFIDEVDVFAGNRDSVISFRTDDILNAFLSEMDGFGDKSDTPVFVIVTTNFSSDRNETKLDPAFLRRFDRTIHIDLPNCEERCEFLKKGLTKIGMSNVSERYIASLAKRSVGLSLAELDLVIQSAVKKCYDDRGLVSLSDDVLREAYETYVDGEARERSERDLEQTAIHEAGHAVIAHILGLKPMYTTIVGRKNYGGYVSFSSENDSTYTKDFLLNKICCAYAGRVAEVREYGKNGITTGIGQDIKVATHLAEMMVTEYGMCDCDFMYYSAERRSDAYVVGKIREILCEQYARTGQLVEEHYDMIKKLATTLLERNSLDEEEITAILDER